MENTQMDVSPMENLLLYAAPYFFHNIYVFCTCIPGPEEWTLIHESFKTNVNILEKDLSEIQPMFSFFRSIHPAHTISVSLVEHVLLRKCLCCTHCFLKQFLELQCHLCDSVWSSAVLSAIDGVIFDSLFKLIFSRAFNLLERVSEFGAIFRDAEFNLFEILSIVQHILKYWEILSAEDGLRLYLLRSPKCTFLNICNRGSQMTVLM